LSDTSEASSQNLPVTVMSELSTGIKEKVIENGDRIMPIDSSDTWKNPKSIECANKRSQKEFEKTRPKAEKGKKKKLTSVRTAGLLTTLLL